jgi:hypothetical protein
MKTLVVAILTVHNLLVKAQTTYKNAAYNQQATTLTPNIDGSCGEIEQLPYYAVDGITFPTYDPTNYCAYAFKSDGPVGEDSFSIEFL